MIVNLSKFKYAAFGYHGYEFKIAGKFDPLDFGLHIL